MGVAMHSYSYFKRCQSPKQKRQHVLRYIWPYFLTEKLGNNSRHYTFLRKVYKNKFIGLFEWKKVLQEKYSIFMFWHSVVIERKSFSSSARVTSPNKRTSRVTSFNKRASRVTSPSKRASRVTLIYPTSEHHVSHHSRSEHHVSYHSTSEHHVSHWFTQQANINAQGQGVVTNRNSQTSSPLIELLKYPDHKENRTS